MEILSRSHFLQSAAGIVATGGTAALN